MGQFKIETVKVDKLYRAKGRASPLWSSYEPELKLERLPLPRNKRSGRRLSEGAYAVVYQSDFYDRVIKITHINLDEGYYLYVKELSKRKKYNPHFPHIYAAKRFIFKNAKILYVEMEKLEDMGRSFYRDKYDSDNMLVPDNETAFIVDCFNWHRERKYHWLLNREPNIRSARSFLRAVEKKYARSHEIGIDSHSGNIMFRNDGTPVVTDPFSGGRWS